MLGEVKVELAKLIKESHKTGSTELTQEIYEKLLQFFINNKELLSLDENFLSEVLELVNQVWNRSIYNKLEVKSSESSGNNTLNLKGLDTMANAIIQSNNPGAGHGGQAPRCGPRARRIS